MSRPRVDPYIPQANSLPSLVVGFFTNNPGEELTVEDIADKFGGARTGLHTNLAMAVQHGLLVRDRNEDGDYIYRAGPKLAPPPPPPAAPAQQPKARRAPAALPDPATVAIDDGIPLPQGRGHRADWQVLLQRLQLGQSAALPVSARASLAKAITDAHKSGAARYAIRTTYQAYTLRVWRTE